VAPGPDSAAWANRLAAHLLRFRRYPADAERRGFTGVVMMRFSVDAAGHVAAQTMLRSSGHDQLDEEAAAWLQRAQPLPVPPPDRVAPAQITVPLAFVLH
jgi:protein TonB